MDTINLIGTTDWFMFQGGQQLREAAQRLAERLNTTKGTKTISTGIHIETGIYSDDELIIEINYTLEPDGEIAYLTSSVNTNDLHHRELNLEIEVPVDIFYGAKWLEDKLQEIIAQDLVSLVQEIET